MKKGIIYPSYLIIIAVLFLVFFSIETKASIDFDAADDVLSCGSDATIDDLGSFTLTAWINPDTRGESNTGAIATKSGASGYLILRFSSGVTNALRFTKHFDGGADVDVIANTNTITLGVWSHVVWTWDGTATATGAKIYVNGSEVAYDTQDNGLGSANSDASLTFRIGNDENSARTFDGKIEEVCLYDTNLSAAQVAMLASSRLRGMCYQVAASNLVGYWPMDDEEDGTSGDGDSFKDKKGVSSCTGSDGANNTGLTANAGAVLSYP